MSFFGNTLNWQRVFGVASVLLVLIAILGMRTTNLAPIQGLDQSNLRLTGPVEVRFERTGWNGLAFASVKIDPATQTLATARSCDGLGASAPSPIWQRSIGNGYQYGIGNTVLFTTDRTEGGPVTTAANGLKWADSIEVASQISPSGRFVVFPGHDQTGTIYDCTTGENLTKLEGSNFTWSTEYDMLFYTTRFTQPLQQKLAVCFIKEEGTRPVANIRTLDEMAAVWPHQ